MTTETKDATPSWRSCFRNDLFQNQVALVTGGSTGIGRAIATELASCGATVIIASRNHDRCEQVAHEITSQLPTGGKVVAGPSTNLKNETEIKELIEYIVQKHGALNLLVNNAGGQFLSNAEDLSRRGFSSVVELNLIGTFLVCREAFLQYMQEHGGSIVNITLGNRNGMPLMSHSGAARAGIENLTATLSTEWMDSNVRINCVRPGIIFTDSGFENYGPAGETYLKQFLQVLPARRCGSPEEVSSAVTWLLSEGAKYVTGTTVSVDGASGFILVPLVDMGSRANLMPVHGTLPRKARL